MPRREARGWVAFARCSCPSPPFTHGYRPLRGISQHTPESRLRLISLLGDARYQSTGFGWALPERVDRGSDPRRCQSRWQRSTPAVNHVIPYLATDLASREAARPLA